MSELDDLAAFATLIQAGSFIRAAGQLGWSKGQLSKRISALEAGHGVQLLHRSTRRLSLTAAGAALLPEAQALVAQMTRARQALALLKDELAGPVRVTVPVSLGEAFFEGLLKMLAGDYPQLTVELDLSNSYRDLAGEGFDLAIRETVANDERLVARPLLTMQEITCASPTYLAVHGVPRAPQDLVEHACLLNSHYGGGEEWRYHQRHELIRVAVAGPFASNHYSLLKKAALAGAGIARLPSYLLHAELREGRLVGLLGEYETASTALYLVHPYQGGMPRRVQVVADYLMAWATRDR